MNTIQHYDVLIIGAGLAGLTVALSLPSHLKIAIVAKADLNTCASYLAQGGIAAVLDADDSFAQHIEDTLIAGAGLCDVQQVEKILHDAPQSIDWLIQQGVTFTCQDNQQLHLTREGGHGQRRVAHVADYTGYEITSTLQQRLKQQFNVTCLTEHDVKTLWVEQGQCKGAVLINAHQQLSTIAAQHTILATGGLGQLFALTTNPVTATGDGVALAWQAGCRVANLEFIQFHPTALALPNADGFLISEALRGEGGILRDHQGRRFMPEYDVRAELAPRDIVARAIANELQKNPSVYLDMTHLSAEFIQHHFPAIYQHCLSLGLDICSQQIPVAPAAHYACGGVFSDADGRSDVVNLYVVGEVACTGLHGANRLASNSLLECVVVGRRIAQLICQPTEWQVPHASAHSIQLQFHPLAPFQYNQSFSFAQLQQRMSQCFGIQRNFADMQQLYQQLLYWRQQCIAQQECVPHGLYTALLMLKSALQRHESRGTHFNQDCPDLSEQIQMTIIDGQSILSARCADLV
ncbi:L-aspartate oxidase [Acinetobacter sp. MD2(2019)]|uniref:L-aspartate oxidase n=1 Tax=Acinetobacter sp. MD2(2019) TaxID=2605273 RepID=UPI002D1F1F73|nr:L-aspartate oxidase [Acinetobacter sp. MD2(2019)]MEB3753950.1 L-aspartate oxidase [Acinetobacter sp. MD2(2019)]